MIDSARWITAPVDMCGASPDFVNRIKLKGAVKKATVSVSAIGLYVCRIDNIKIGDNLFAPGMTSYRDHVQYAQYDVTDIINDGSEISVICGNGWAVGHVGFYYFEKQYANEIHCVFSLDIEYETGERESVVSGDDTEVYSSDIVFSDIYDGETVDKTAQRRLIGRAVQKDYQTHLVKQVGESVKEHERIHPLRFIKTPNGERVIDFGQNLTGYVCVRAHGKKGDKISFRHAEVLDRHGNFYTENLRKAKCESHYILSDEKEELKPSFSFYGFRYICIDEYPYEISLDDFCAVEVHSEMERTCTFVCGNDKINQLYSNIIWGQKDNFLDIPTDCPQRDERLGWTGDAQVFARTAAINFDVEKFFSKWLWDMRCEQEENGGIRAFVPDCSLNSRQNCCAGWGDAIVICTWEMYRAYGNKKILEDNFDAMCRWIEYMHNAGPEEYLWLEGEQFGDWLGLDNGDGELKGATDQDMIASCYFAYSTSLVIKSAKVLGKDTTYFEDMYTRIITAIREKFTSCGLPVCRTQTACALLIYFGICEDKERVGKLLAELIKENGNKLTTGFIGTPYLLSALSETGNTDIAFDLLFEEGYPSWLYSVNHGATTMWEHWDGIKEDGSFWSKDMNSFNHYAYGSVFAWVFETVGGIRIPDGGEGYSEIIIAPVPDKRLRFSDISMKTRKGTIRSFWKYCDGYVRYEIEVPKDIRAKIVLPDGREYNAQGNNIFYTI